MAGNKLFLVIMYSMSGMDSYKVAMCPTVANYVTLIPVITSDVTGTN